MEASNVGGDMNISVYELLQDWEEGTQDGAAGVSNWNDRLSGPTQTWTTPSGDFNVTAVDNIFATTAGQHTWDVTSLVSAWVAGSKVNNGLLVASPDGGV